MRIRKSPPGIGFLDSRFVNTTGDTMTGSLGITNVLRALSHVYSDPTSGTGIDILYDSVTDVGFLVAIDRAASLYKQIFYSAQQHTFRTAGTDKVVINEAGDVLIYSGGDLNVYSDAGTTVKFSVDGATGNTTVVGGLNLGTGSGAAAGAIQASAGATFRADVYAIQDTASIFYPTSYGTTNVPGLTGQRGRGTEAIPSAVLTDDVLCRIGGRGYDGSVMNTALRSQFRYNAAENWTTTAQGAYIGFWTTTIGGTSTTEKIRVSDAGFLGINQTAPSNWLHIKAADNGTCAQFQINATSANITTADTFANFTNSTEVVLGSIAGTATSGLIAYNTFTGAHFVQLAKEDERIEMGMIVVAIDKLIPDTGGGREYLPFITKSTKKQDKAVFGVFSDRVAIKCENKHEEVDIYELDEEGNRVATGEKKIKRCPRKEYPHTCEYGKGDNAKDLYQVFGLGAGIILVTDTNGNIEVGDYIQSSPVAGLGEKQDNDVLRNYTVAKATEKVDWTKETVKKKLIACTYHVS